MAQSREETVAAFFPRLERIGGLVGALTDYAPLQVVIELRNTPTRVLLDMSASPFRVATGGPGLEGDVGLAASPDDLHSAFTGAIGVMQGVAERRLLMRGSMGKLVLLFPVVAQIPVMYGEHLEALDETRRKPGPLARACAWLFNLLAAGFVYLVGLVLRGADRAEVLSVLEAMSRGAARFSPSVSVAPPSPPKEASTSNPLDAPPAPPWRRLWLGVLTAKMYWAGWFVSVLKHRLGVPVDIFRVMESFSAGVGRPPPAEKTREAS
jgi:hypothetical protein